MAVADDVTALYLSILKRYPDSAGLTDYVAAVNAGLSLAAVETAIRSSPEAQIVAIYQRELGRVPETAAVQADSAFLAQGGTVGDIIRNVALSDEARRVINTIYNQVLGRSVDPSGLGSFRAALANGASLADVRSAIVFSREGQNTLNTAFQSELGRPAPTAATAPFTQTLLNGGSLFDVKNLIASSQEATNDIVQAYLIASGTTPNAVAVAAAASELQSGVPLDGVYREIGQLSNRALPNPVTGLSNININVTATSVLGSTGPVFISSLGNNDAVVTSAAKFITLPNATSTIVTNLSTYKDPTTGEGRFNAAISDFNPASDYIQLQSYQAASFSDLKISGYTAPNPSTTIILDAHNSIDIFGVAPGTLQASNFHFV